MLRAAPDIGEILRVIQDLEVEYVLAGSVAVQAWGADIGVPGDIDIIPATDVLNLRRLVAALGEMEATAFLYRESGAKSMVNQHGTSSHLMILAVISHCLHRTLPTWPHSILYSTPHTARQISFR